jgi:ribonuclease III
MRGTGFDPFSCCPAKAGFGGPAWRQAGLATVLQGVCSMKSPDALRRSIKQFQEGLGYVYRDSEHAVEALIHSSWVNENAETAAGSNERLEYLGDALLDFVMADRLFRIRPSLSEGEMSRLRSLVVCEASLAQVARDMSLGQWLLMGRGEDRSGGRDRPSILADALEAVFGGVYLDGGLVQASGLIERLLEPTVAAALSGEAPKDYKTLLQEVLQQAGNVRIAYRVVESSGPDHARLFRVAVTCEGAVLGEGTGHSKKEAEQEAAHNALREQEGRNAGIQH